MEVETRMIEEKEKKTEHTHSHVTDAEEVKEILGVVSKELPELIKGLISSVFSEEAGREMGKAAAAFYKQLKEAGMPEETAVRMTEDYMGTFTSLGSMIKNVTIGDKKHEGKHDLSERISRQVEEKLREKHHDEEDEEEEDED